MAEISTDRMMAAFSLALEAEAQARKMGEFLYEKPWDSIDELKRRELLWSSMANLGFAICRMAAETAAPPSKD